MTVTHAGPDHVAGAHGAGAHALPPPVQMVQMLAGFQVSQALYAAAALGIADRLRGRQRDAAAVAGDVGADAMSVGFEFEAVTATPTPVSIITARA